MKKFSLLKLHELYIHGTAEKAPIVFQATILCNTTNAVVKSVGLKSPKIHITTRMLKHLYDSKPAEEYEFILQNLVSIVRYPDQIYENKEGKRGQFCFVKNIKENNYICSLEVSAEVTEEKTEGMNFVATAFRVRRKGYLRDYKLLWDRKGGEPSS